MVTFIHPCMMPQAPLMIDWVRVRVYGDADAIILPALIKRGADIASLYSGGGC